MPIAARDQFRHTQSTQVSCDQRIMIKPHNLLPNAIFLRNPKQTIFPTQSILPLQALRLILPILQDPSSFGENVCVRDCESSEYDVCQILPIRVSQLCFTSGNFGKLSFRDQTQWLIILSIQRFQLRASGEGVSCTILITRLIVNLIVVVCQQLQPAHLSSIENVRFCKVFKVLVVSEDLEWEFCSFEPVLPILKSFYNCEHLFIRYSVVAFGWIH